MKLVLIYFVIYLLAVLCQLKCDDCECDCGFEGDLMRRFNAYQHSFFPRARLGPSPRPRARPRP